MALPGHIRRMKILRRHPTVTPANGESRGIGAVDTRFRGYDEGYGIHSIVMTMCIKRVEGEGVWAGSVKNRSGAGDGIRTHDFLLGKQTLYH